MRDPKAQLCLAYLRFQNQMSLAYGSSGVLTCLFVHFSAFKDISPLFPSLAGLCFRRLILTLRNNLRLTSLAACER